MTFKSIFVGLITIFVGFLLTVWALGQAQSMTHLDAHHTLEFFFWAGVSIGGFALSEWGACIMFGKKPYLDTS